MKGMSQAAGTDLTYQHPLAELPSGEVWRMSCTKIASFVPLCILSCGALTSVDQLSRPYQVVSGPAAAYATKPSADPSVLPAVAVALF